MTTEELKRRVLELPERERLEIADAAWTSLPDPDLLALPLWQRELVEERLLSEVAEPGVDWEDLRDSLWPPKA